MGNELHETGGCLPFHTICRCPGPPIGADAFWGSNGCGKEMPHPWHGRMHWKCSRKRTSVQEYKIHNAEVLFREDCDMDDLIDVIEGNRRYIKCL